jgi:hypothetical protein
MKSLFEIISLPEVVAQIRKALCGEVTVVLLHPRAARWRDVYSGLVAFWFGDWLFNIYNDCDKLSHILGVLAPDGRESGPQDWGFDDQARGMRRSCPLEVLSEDERKALEILINKAV